MNVFEHIFATIPAHTTSGKRRAIGGALRAGVELKEAVRVASTRDDLASKGRAALIATAVKSVGAALQVSRRQYVYHAKKLEAQETAVRTKAIGEAKPVDAEYRQYLRSLNDADRIQKVLSDPSARGAALREPALSGLNDDVLSRALDTAIEQNAAGEAAALENAKEAHVSHGASVEALVNELMKTPFIVDQSGEVRSFISSNELENFLAKNVPAPSTWEIAGEEAIADHVEAA